MSARLHQAAQAIADHFNAVEARRGEPIKDVFPTRLEGGKPQVNVIGVPVPMLRALIACLTSTTAPSAAVALQWVVAQQHPTRKEVSIFITQQERVAKDYEAIGWTVMPVHGLPACASSSEFEGAESIETSEGEAIDPPRRS